MFRHVVLFRLSPDAPDGQAALIIRELRGLPAQIPELLDYKVGTDVGLADANYDIAVVADFDDADGWRTYVAHPAHEAVAATHIRPYIAERAAVQFDLV